MTISRTRSRSSVAFVCIVAMATLLAGCDWAMFGFDATHASNNGLETSLGLSNVAALHQVWTAVTPDKIVSPPSIASGVAYVGTADNKLYAFNENGKTGCSGTPKTCTPLWSTPSLGGDIVTTPAVADGRVYVGSIGAKFDAFDAAGTTNCSGTPKVCQPLWSRTMSGDVIAPPTVVSGVVYVIAANDFSDELDAINDSTGALLWSALLDSDLGSNLHTTSAVSVANGIAYAGFDADGPDDAMVAAFDANGVNGCSGTPTTCNPLWTAPLDNALQESTPVLANGSVFAATDDPSGMNVYDAAGSTGCSGSPTTCTPLWTAVAPLAKPAVANGIVFVGADAFDATGVSGCGGTPKTCTPLWTNASGTVGAIANGVAYSTSSTQVTAYDAAGATSCAGSPKTCASLWSTSVSNPTAPVIVDGRLWIGSTDHTLHVYAPS